jgi:ketosteroid isomerase-like protein
MSQENVELVRRIYEEVSASLVLPRELFDPDCVTDWTQVSPDFGVLRGVDASQAALASYFETFENFHVAAEEIVHADEQRVITAVRDGGRIKGTDGEVWNRFFHAWTFRDGKVIRLSSHTDRDQALEAAGLSDQAMSQENVEVVRATVDSYAKGDRDAYLGFFAEDVEVRPDVSRFPEAKPFRGREEFRRFLADIDQGWEGGGTAVLSEIFPVGDRVVARADWGGRGRASGVDLRSSLTSLYTFQDGQIIKIEYFFDHAKALEAVGLSG